MSWWSSGFSVCALAEATTNAAPNPQSTEHLLMLVLLQLCVIVIAARLAAAMFRKIGQPAVVGEIIAGLMLGPSVLGRIEQAIWGAGMHPVSGTLFSADAMPIFDGFKELGLVFLLFLVGLEFDFSHLKAHGKSAVSISLAGVALPFALGFGLGYAIHPYVGREMLGGVMRQVDVNGFALFMGTATSITAVPVLGRMMMEWNVTRTRIGTVTISAAAMNDAIGWILLAAVSATVKTGFDPLGTVVMTLQVAAFTLAMIFVVRPLVIRWLTTAMKDGKIGLGGMAGVLVLMFVCAMTTSLIGIFAIFGAFILGAVLSDQQAFRDHIVGQLRSFITVLFLPIFFAYTGLKTDMGSLGGGQMWLIGAVVCAAAIAGKLAGCSLAARVGGFSWRESGIIGVLMNTRGLMELIVINVGWQLGVIPRSVFCMLVLMALVTTIMTTPLLLPLMRGTEFEPLMVASGFARRRIGKAERLQELLSH